MRGAYGCNEASPTEIQSMDFLQRKPIASFKVEFLNFKYAPPLYWRKVARLIADSDCTVSGI
jgi:hypothetical protein